MGIARGVSADKATSIRHWRLVWALIASLVFISACSGAATPASTTDPTATSLTSGGTPSTTVTTVPPSTVAQADPSDEALAVWDAFWVAWVDVRAAEVPGPELFEPVATVPVIDDVLVVIERQHGVSGPVDTTVTLSPTVTAENASEVVIQDCVLMVPSITESVGVWYEGVVENDGSGWKVGSLRIAETSGCVPAEMATDAIEAYESYYEAIPEFWDPPNPDHPVLSDLFAEPRLTGIRDLLAEHAERGVTLRSHPTTHPEVVEVRGPTEFVILDCYEPGLDDGVYDLATGERLPDEPEVRPGQRNLRSAVMVFEEGRWRASDFQGQVDHECEFAPTDRGLPSV
jgi:hypothetical protein